MTQTQPDAMLDRVRMLCELKRFEEAAALARRAIAVHADDARAWCLLAQALWGENDFDTMLEAANRAAALAPEDEWPHRLRSLAFTGQQHQTAALMAALDCVRLAPYSWRSHTRVATTSSTLDMHGQAEQAAEKAVELAPNEADAWTIAGNVAARAGRRDLAAERYTRALRLDPHNGGAHNGLGRLHMSAGGFNVGGLARATSGFMRAVRADPHDQRSRHGIDIALRVFLARTAYFIFLVGYLVGEVFRDYDGAGPRIGVAAAMCLPALFVWHFVAKLDPAGRRYLLNTLRHGRVAVSTCAEVVAVTMIVVATFVPHQHRGLATLVAILAALAARLVLLAELRRTSRGTR